MWPWLTKLVPKLSLAAAQKQNFDTKVMLLEAKYEKAIEKLETENQNLRLEVERLKKENQELQSSSSILKQSVQWYEDMEKVREEPPHPGDGGFSFASE